MNSLVMSGRLIDDARTSAGATPLTRLTFEVDGGELPLRFLVLCYGTQSNRAAELKGNDVVLVSGRMVASARNKTMAVIANGVEFLYENGEQDGKSTSKVK
jgi:hypothetical protein